MNIRKERGNRAICWGVLLAMAALTLGATGCASWRDRVGERGESRIYQAAWEDVYAAVREEAEDRDFRVRYGSVEEGRLTALSRLRSESAFRSTRQTELEFYLRTGIPGETEVRLLIREIEERDTAAGPSLSRQTIRGTALYRQILDGIEERLEQRKPIFFLRGAGSTEILSTLQDTESQSS